jgi:SAM-dependent methyltransferase
MLAALGGGALVALVGVVICKMSGTIQGIRLGALILFGAAFVAFSLFFLWAAFAYRAFSYRGRRHVGCGSGALTIACAKANPQVSMIGIDRWGKEYASFSKRLCENNARAEKIGNASFQAGDAVKLDFADETFDAVVSNYVYHNIVRVDRQQLLRETLRVLKKGGTFAIHDLMSPRRYGDMQTFIQSLKDEGYESVELLDTASGKFMSMRESRWLMLTDSKLLVGKK